MEDSILSTEERLSFPNPPHLIFSITINGRRNQYFFCTNAAYKQFNYATLCHIVANSDVEALNECIIQCNNHINWHDYDYEVLKRCRGIGVLLILLNSRINAREYPNAMNRLLAPGTHFTIFQLIEVNCKLPEERKWDIHNNCELPLRMLISQNLKHQLYYFLITKSGFSSEVMDRCYLYCEQYNRECFEIMHAYYLKNKLTIPNGEPRQIYMLHCCQSGDRTFPVYYTESGSLVLMMEK